MRVCRCKEDKRVPVLTLPRLLSQDTEVRLTTEPLAGPDLAAWQPIERVVKDAVTGQDRCGYYLQLNIFTRPTMLQRVAPVHVSAALQQPDLQPAAAQGRGGGAHPSQGAQQRLELLTKFCYIFTV